MTPLEIAAKAAYDEWISPVIGVESSWEELPESHRSRMVESQRAALLALADSACPRETLLPHGLTPRNWATMRSVLRTITEEAK